MCIVSFLKRECELSNRNVIRKSSRSGIRSQWRTRLKHRKFPGPKGLLDRGFTLPRSKPAVRFFPLRRLSTLVYSGMDSHPPTYLLRPDFEARLESFTNAFLAAGCEIFSPEFANLDAFLQTAQTDDPDRDDRQLRQTEKPFYLLEAVAYRIYDSLTASGSIRTKSTLIVLPDCLTLTIRIAKRRTFRTEMSAPAARRIVWRIRSKGWRIVLGRSRILQENAKRTVWNSQAAETEDLGVIGNRVPAHAGARDADRNGTGDSRARDSAGILRLRPLDR